MKITPLEIRQKDFEKKLRGYDKDEVNAFLQSLSNEWERMLEDNKDAHLKYQQAEREVKKLREVESSLYKTLKTAEDTGANVIDQANKAAELHMKETQMNAEALLNESKNKAKSMIEQAELEARQIVGELQQEVKKLEQNLQEIESQRENALHDMKNLSLALLEKVEKNSEQQKEFRVDDYVKRVKKLTIESEARIKAEKTTLQVESKVIEKAAAEKQAKAEESTQESILFKPKTEAKKPIVTQKIAKDEGLKDSFSKREELLKTKKNEAFTLPKVERKKEELPKVDIPSKEVKKQPRIAKTVSFFDELDADS